MVTQDYPQRFQNIAAESSKTLVVVIDIDGVPDYLTTGDLYKVVRYGDPDLDYGDPGLVYGGLAKRDDFKPYINLDGSMSISQKIEPEQGRGAITLLSLSFTDKDSYLSKIISPGVVVDEVLGNKFCKVWIGFQNSSFPEDYFVIMRGYVSGTKYSPAKVDLQFADPNIKRMAQVCDVPTSALVGDIDDVVTTIPVVGTGAFYDQILGPDGTYDPAIKTYIKIDDEFMEYGPGDLAPTSVTVTRGARGSTPAPHTDTTEVDNIIQFQDNMVNLALKLALSGHNGDFIDGVLVSSIVDTGDPSLGFVPNSITFPVDTNDEYGITPGDWLTISGSTAGNDGTYQVSSIADALGFPNRILIVTGGTLNIESPASSVQIAFRSQFDTFPVFAGAQLDPFEVDVNTFITLKDQFLSQDENRLRFLIFESFNLKQFTESQLFLPFGAYSITRFGRLSMTLTKPPIAGEKLITLDASNVLDQQNMTLERALNTRRYYSEIDYSLDLADDNQTYQTNFAFLDADTLSKITVSSVLPIQSDGLRTDLHAVSLLIPRQALFLSRRYNNVAHELKLKANFGAGSQIEAGDIVNVSDNGTLKILNYTDGSRNSGEQLFEVIDRSLDLKTGIASLTLLSNVGYEVTDRFATISPSSIVGVGSTTTRIIITDSFGQFFPLQEGKKWQDYVGLPIHVHSYDYSTSDTSTFLGLDPTNDHALLVSPALGFTPSPGDIVDIDDYPDTTNPADNRLYKLLYCFIDPTATITAGSSDTQFTVSLSDAALLVIGLPVLVHNQSYSILSPEVNVLTIDTGTGVVTVDSSLGFTPASGQLVELIGFHDGGGPYRII